MVSSWRSRLARADEHLEEVEREVQRFLATEPYRVVGELKPHPLLPKVLNYDIRGNILRPPDPRFGDVVGDFIENVRSALDLIAYRLASAKGDPASGTEFPVFWSPDHYGNTDKKGNPARGSGLSKVRSMSPAAQTAIERLQPYDGVDPADFAAAGPGVVPEQVLRHPLYLVHNLRQTNFHREPHVTGAIAARVGLGFNTLRDLNMLVNPSSSGIRVGAFDDGARVGLIQFTITGPDPTVQMNIHPTFDVAFEPEGPARGQSVIPTLRSIRDHIENVVFPQLEPLV